MSNIFVITKVTRAVKVLKFLFKLYVCTIYFDDIIIIRTEGCSWYLLQIIVLAVNIILKLEIFIKILYIYRLGTATCVLRDRDPHI